MSAPTLSLSRLKHVGFYRDMSAQILDFEDDLLDAQLRYVEEDIRLCRRLSVMTMPAGVALSPRQLAGAQGVVFHAPPSGTLAEYARLESGDPGTGFPGMGGWLGRVRRRADSEFRRRAATRASPGSHARTSHAHKAAPPIAAPAIRIFFTGTSPR
jgi:hypothetical protein